jgi:ABC-type sugar transport system substrate-binding protein
MRKRVGSDLENHKKKGGLKMRSRKVKLVMILLLVMGFVFAGMSDLSKAYAAQKKLKIAAVFQLGFIDFFVPTRMGAEDAAKKYGADFEWLGPHDSSIQTQISMIETLLVKGVDGLVIEATEPANVAPIAKKAQDMGIPVVITNELTTEAKGFNGYCGADPIAVGTLQGKQLEQIMLGKGPWAGKWGYKGGEVAGKVAFFMDAPGARNIEGRIQGGREYLKKFPKIVDVGKYDSTLSIEKGQEVANNFITANSDLKAIVNAGSVPTVAAGMAVRERDLTGKVIVVGMDLLPQTLRLLKDGIISVTVGQNPYLQGYLPVQAICEYLLNKKPIPERMPTDLEVVDLTNVDKIMQREVDFLEKGKKK